jgi:hypothetical protein
MGYKINIRNALDTGWNNILKDENIEHDYTTTGIGTSANTTDNVELALKYIHDNFVPDSIDSYRYRETVTPAASAWTITHNLGEQLVSVTVMDSDDTMISPAQVSFDSTTELTITFNEPVSGQVLVIK